MGKSKSFNPDVNLKSKKLPEELERLADCVIQKLISKELIPQTVSVKIIRSDLEVERKCKWFITKK
jgi:hypothetical protein